MISIGILIIEEAVKNDKNIVIASIHQGMLEEIMNDV